jgi:hypothetical protein
MYFLNRQRLFCIIRIDVSFVRNVKDEW